MTKRHGWLLRALLVFALFLHYLRGNARRRYDLEKARRKRWHVASTPNDCTSVGGVARRLGRAVEEAMEESSRHQWGIHVTIPSKVSGLDQDQQASFDVPHLLWVTNTTSVGDMESFFLAVFHANVGGDSEYTGQYQAIYVARSNSIDSPGQVPSKWRVLSKLATRGSMGYLHWHPDGKQLFLAYELEDFLHGNTIAIRLYPSLQALITSSWYNEVQLKQRVKIWPWFFLPVPVVSVGTPTFSKVVVQDKKTTIYLRFYYYLWTDLPGTGIVNFQPPHDNQQQQHVLKGYSWNAKQDDTVVTALRKLQVMGKIGQRATLQHPSDHSSSFLLFEGKMANADEQYIGWLSCRPILYDASSQQAAIVPLALPQQLQTFCNPTITYIQGNDDYWALSFFVPGEPFRDGLPETYANYTPVEKCPTCAANPMQKAESPAKKGALLVMIKVDSVFPSPC
ncbi:expressed unknown protein [Seminavis robusta]|uniref:Uncharacterized protein n=1 Tax=Seminavis robusta TaxID=568900 RepID=A0A9N8HW55_9STRA|nr:expressed unknown protein [Seminavis robusta]|eukprot:Sro1601_g285120.1 n/a (452) ;mRNA; r:3522-4877